MKSLFAKKRNFQTIISPLWDVELDLSAYIGEMENRITSLEEEKKDLERKIEGIKIEIEKAKEEKERASEAVPKLSEILAGQPFCGFKIEGTDF